MSNEKNKSNSPGKGVVRTKRSNSWDATATNDFCRVQFVLRKEKIFQRPKTAPYFSANAIVQEEPSTVSEFTTRF